MVYVVTATAALYLNCFVAVVQAFEKMPSCKLWRRRNPNPRS